MVLYTVKAIMVVEQVQLTEKMAYNITVNTSLSNNISLWEVGMSPGSFVWV